jgi:hypothetical protein
MLLPIVATYISFEFKFLDSAAKTSDVVHVGKTFAVRIYNDEEALGKNAKW